MGEPSAGPCSPSPGSRGEMVSALSQDAPTSCRLNEGKIRRYSTVKERGKNKEENRKKVLTFGAGFAIVIKHFARAPLRKRRADLKCGYHKGSEAKDFEID